jgi:DNA-binding MurR/RpiR family transcriptional regulator
MKDKFEVIYSRLVKAMGDKGDLLVGISTSGNSKNIVLALEEAKEKDMITISFTGNGGGKMKEKSDYVLGSARLTFGYKRHRIYLLIGLKYINFILILFVKLFYFTFFIVN